MSNMITAQAAKLGSFFGMEGDGAELVNVLKATAFKGQVSDAQMAALMVVANQYKLNPFTKELYAFPDRNNGIVPVVGVDGWSRIINDHPQFDGMEFEQTDEACTCVIFRKDRSRPIKVTEYMAECKRDGVGPWKSHPKRMLRHKAMIQCARLAFGYGGIYDQDEAERIVSEKEVKGELLHKTPSAPQALPPCGDETFAKNLSKVSAAVQSGEKTAEYVIAQFGSRYTLTDAQIEAIRKLEEAAPIDGHVIDASTDDFVSAMNAAEGIAS